MQWRNTHFRRSSTRKVGNHATVVYRMKTTKTLINIIFAAAVIRTELCFKFQNTRSTDKYL